MDEIRIGPGAQRIALLVFVAATAAALLAQVPEIKRYINMKRM